MKVKQVCLGGVVLAGHVGSTPSTPKGKSGKSKIAVRPGIIQESSPGFLKLENTNPGRRPLM